MIVYIAGPMTGLPEHNYPAFLAAEDALRDAGYVVLNPVDSERDSPTPGTPQSWDWYMRAAIGMVIAADGIALLPGWEWSRGARPEVTVAHALGMKAMPLNLWLDAAKVREAAGGAS